MGGGQGVNQCRDSRGVRGRGKCQSQTGEAMRGVEVGWPADAQTLSLTLSRRRARGLALIGGRVVRQAHHEPIGFLDSRLSGNGGHQRVMQTHRRRARRLSDVRPLPYPGGGRPRVRVSGPNAAMMRALTPSQTAVVRKAAPKPHVSTMAPAATGPTNAPRF